MPRLGRLVVLAAVVAALALAAAAVGRELFPAPWPRPATVAAPTPAPLGRAGVPAFRHVFLIVMENEGAGALLAARLPFLHSLLSRGAVAVDDYAPAHPSLPNYLFLVSGRTFGLTSDCSTCLVSGPNLPALLARHRLTFGAYLEGLPRPGFLGAAWWPGLYVGKHNPFRYFRALRAPAWANRLQPLDRLPPALRRGTVPNFVWITPDLCHDMHSCPPVVGDRWLKAVVPAILASPAFRAGGLLLITWDEGIGSGPGPLAGGGRVLLLALSPNARPGFVDRRRVTQADLLRTVEDAFGLPALGASRQARPLTELFRP